MKQPKLRIAQVAPLWMPIPPRTYGGIELVMKLLIDELVVRGHEVTLFGSADCVTSAQLRAVVEMNLTDRMAAGQAYCFEYYASSTMAEVLRSAGEFDVIHYHVSSAWLPLAALTGPPGLFTMHATPQIDDEWVFRRWPQVAVNGISRWQLRSAGLRLGREFPVVYNGCDFDAYEPSYEPGEYLAYLGRMSEEKNPLGAIRLAQAVDIPIVLAGQPKDGNDECYFADHVRPLIDGDRVRWVGEVDHRQKTALLRRASALVFPIQWDEPFGLVMIEAMACGTPVIGIRRGAVAEVIDQGITGFHAGVIDGLAELVPRTLELDRRQVREHAQGRFRFQAMVDGYLALYQRLRRTEPGPQ